MNGRYFYKKDENGKDILTDESGDWWIGASRDIEPGEELTWSYTLYNIE